MGANQTNTQEIVFPNGLLGFPEWRCFLLEQREEMDPVLILKSQDQEGLSFLLANPLTWFPSWKWNATPEQLLATGATSPEDITALAIVNVEADPFLVTANLIGPLLINPRTGIGIQIVLENAPYQVRHPLTLQTLALEIPEGLAGIPEWTSFVLQTVDELRPVKLLACRQSPYVSFPVVSPLAIDPNFQPTLSAEDLEFLGDAQDGLEWLSILNVQADPFEVTANMLGPIVYNPETCLARQVILSQSGYVPAHPLRPFDFDLPDETSN